MNARENILLEYETLSDGATAAGELCPVCEGGATGERTLSVTRQDGYLKWMCHRASCGFRGIESSSARAYGSTTTSVSCRGAVGRDYIRSAQAVPAAIQEMLSECYQITESHIAKWNIGWNKEEQRLVIPALGPSGEVLGSVLRSLNPSVKPKSKSHTEDQALSWNINATTKALIIVEDQFSSIRFSDYLSSVSLLGTNLSDLRMDEIKASQLHPIYIALDADAWVLSVKYAIKYRLKLLRLTKDGKDMNNEEMYSFVNKEISIR